MAEVECVIIPSYSRPSAWFSLMEGYKLLEQFVNQFRTNFVN